MSKQNLADNLRLLCSYKKSISEVCRELDINRQQFNKYLSGKTAPSGNNFRLICDYFGVEEYEILMPHDEFEPIIRARPVADTESSPVRRPEFEFLDQLIKHSNDDLSKYEGGYYIYYHSTSYPGKVLKGYGVIYEEESRHFFKWIERLSLKGSSGRDGFVYKIKGLVLGLGNRIFISGYEQLLNNEMIHLTLFPTYKNKVSQLAGLMLGVSGTDSREPVCQRLILSYLGRSTDHRQALKHCGIFDEDSDEVDGEIRTRIQNTIEPGESVFRGRPL
ncbi:MAG: helix-turn-helix transcriptional regulator [Motiliproteus sp.]